MAKPDDANTAPVPSITTTAADDFDEDGFSEGPTLTLARGTLPPAQQPQDPPQASDAGEESTRVCSPGELADSLAKMASLEAQDIAATMIIPLAAAAPAAPSEDRNYIAALDRARVVRLVRTRRILLATFVGVGLGTVAAAAAYGCLF